jgi:prevent-host-death family protein
MENEQVSVRELRARLSEYLGRAHGGERITITRAGRIDAVLGPIETKETDDGDD